MSVPSVAILSSPSEQGGDIRLISPPWSEPDWWDRSYQVLCMQDDFGWISTCVVESSQKFMRLLETIQRRPIDAGCCLSCRVSIQKMISSQLTLLSIDNDQGGCGFAGGVGGGSNPKSQQMWRVAGRLGKQNFIGALRDPKSSDFQWKE